VCQSPAVHCSRDAARLESRLGVVVVQRSPAGRKSVRRA
jgi:hypothetical protein